LCHKDYSKNTQREGFCFPFLFFFVEREGQRQDRMNSCIHSVKENQWTTTTTMTTSGGDNDDDANIFFGGGGGGGDNFLEPADGDNAPAFKEADDDDDDDDHPVEETTKDGSHNNENNSNKLLQEEVTAHHGRTYWYASLRDRYSIAEVEAVDEPPDDDDSVAVMMAQQLDRLVLTTAVSSSSSSTGSRHCRSNAVIDFGDVFVEDGGLLQLGGEDRSLLRAENEPPTTLSSSSLGNGEKAGDRRSKPRGRSSTASSSSGPPRSLNQETFSCDGWHDKWQFQEHFASHTVWF
jgi:hypothetical protein